MKTAQALPSYSFKIRSQIAFPLRLGLLGGLFPSGFLPTLNSVRISPLSLTCQLLHVIVLAASCACLHPCRRATLQQLQRAE